MAAISKILSITPIKSSVPVIEIFSLENYGGVVYMQRPFAPAMPCHP